jgi:hypothetical protein
MALMDLPKRFSNRLAILAMASACIANRDLAAADGFRIETKVFVGEEETPVSENTTLFSEGIVYDFLNEPKQTTVFRMPLASKPGRFILLDEKSRASTEISTEKLVGAMEKVRNWAARQRDPFLKFAANPDFKESFEPDTGKLVLASHLESYDVSTSPAERPDAMNEYKEFLDWYAQLNALVSAGPPPDPRLRLNEALARHRAVPITVQLTRSGEKEPLRAEHDFVWRLSQDDMARIEEARAALASYRKLENAEFLRLTRDDEAAE